jgi:hypothetical protein
MLHLFHTLAGTAAGVHVSWCPGHMEVLGNERADALAHLGASGELDPECVGPTASGIKSRLRTAISSAQSSWWGRAKRSSRYDAWSLDYKVAVRPEHGFPRALLHRYLAMRHGHGEFAAYHHRFNHEDAKLICVRCSQETSPSHLVHCRASVLRWKRWPGRGKHFRARPTREECAVYVLVGSRNLAKPTAPLN